MQVARLHGAGDIRVHDEPIPVPGPGEVLVRVEAVGLCGSDAHWYEDGGIGDTDLERPIVLGHEIAGAVEGADGGWQPVVVDPSIPCGACPTCAAGLEDLCPSARFAGFGPTDGGVRAWLPWPRERLVPVPATLDPVAACQLEALGVALRAIHRAGIGPGVDVAVIGTGPIGQLVIRAARASGARRIVATDRLAHRVVAAQASGADAAWLADAPAADPAPVDVAIECAGTDPAVEAAMTMVRPGGHVVLVGIPSRDRTTFPASLARRKGLTVSLSRRMRARDLTAAVALVGAARVDLDGLASDVLDLAEAPRAFVALAGRSGGKIVVRPQHAIV